MSAGAKHKPNAGHGKQVVDGWLIGQTSAADLQRIRPDVGQPAHVTDAAGASSDETGIPSVGWLVCSSRLNLLHSASTIAGGDSAHPDTRSVAAIVHRCDAQSNCSA